MKAIPAEPIFDKYATVTKKQGQFSLDFIYSDSLGEIEIGIKEATQGLNVANLAIALAIAKIDQEALYVQAKCKSYLEYLDKAEDRLNMARQTISDYKRMGETYLLYKSQLQKAGFDWEGNLHKLRYLEKALQIHRSSDVFKD